MIVKMSAMQSSHYTARTVQFELIARNSSDSHTLVNRKTDSPDSLVTFLLSESNDFISKI